ncbi:MAG TPA: malto-oligosyltrehalose trehalohydrolase [Terracidiphilus sp.]|nr:malto-oligosyltrehalose trehalohydrolase [Terracidiphilus sp.]
MHRFEVWAPFAKKMAVETDGAPVAMQPEGDRGWWQADVEGAGPGTDYGYLIDGEAKAYPDPRSQWQPNGVHELSRVYDQQAFRWTDDGFRPSPLASAIIYELHLGTFTEAGTLDAAIEKLDALVELGITHVELLPVAAFGGDYGWGYDGVDLFAVHEPYGGPDALKRFVDAAHSKGFAVLLDVVYNHFGPSGNYTGKYAPYLIDSHKTPWGGAVNLEAAGAHEVRRFFCDNALMWLRDFHCDGLRLDAVHAFMDRSAIHFLEQLSIEVETLNATLGKQHVLIAESDLNDPRIVTPRDAGGLGMDAQWSDDFHHALFAALVREPEGGYYADFGTLEQLAKAIERTFVYDGTYSQHRQRVHGRPVIGLSQHRFLGFIQNHDQVGNRAQGERLTESVGIDRAKIAAALVLLSPFVPMLFQGEEWAASSPFQYFAHHDDPELAKAVSAGRKHEFDAFGWNPDSIPDPEKRETFERSRLNWDERTVNPHADMLRWYRALIELRRTTPSLNVGEPGNARATFDEGTRWLRIERGSISVVCNLGSATCEFDVNEQTALLLASRAEVKATGGKLVLPPDSVVVVKKPD